MERLFVSGLNEDACFFGDNDTYMTTRLNLRERRLLSCCALSARGLAYSALSAIVSTSSAASETEEVDESNAGSEQVVSFLPEEDAFLPRAIPGRLEDLPTILRHLSGWKSSFYSSNLSAEQLIMLPFRRKSKRIVKNDLLSKVLSDTAQK
jgi:hypothetical protein